MALRTKPTTAWRPIHRNLKRLRALTQNNLTKLSLTVKRSTPLALTLALVLLLPFTLTISLFTTNITLPVARPVDRQLLTLNKSPATSNFVSSPYIDPCSTATPQLILHFDPSSQFSKEFDHPAIGDTDHPGLNRVFATFFDTYLFEPNSDIIVNLSAHGRGRATDVQNSLIFAQRALRDYFADPSIVVRNYSLGYSHLDRVRGSRYVFHLVSSSDSTPERQDAVALQRTFDGSCYISVREYSDRLFDDALYVVVPYSNRPKRLRWFLEQFDRLRFGGVVLRLVLAVCKEIEDDVKVANRLVAALRFAQDVQVVQAPGDRTGFFSRAVAVREGSRVVPSHSIMFITDVDMYIFPTMFNSCRLNTIEGSQVYFPVFYSLYARSTRIDRDAGYWRDSSFGMSCMYKSDFDTVAAYDGAELAFVGWGGEDIALSQAFLNHSQYEVFRAVEPALRHKWHMKECEPFTSAYDDCISVLFQQLGTMATVGKYLLEKNIDAQALFAAHEDEDANQDQSSNAVRELRVDHNGRIDRAREKLRRRQEYLRVNHRLLTDRRTETERRRVRKASQSGLVTKQLRDR